MKKTFIALTASVLGLSSAAFAQDARQQAIDQDICKGAEPVSAEFIDDGTNIRVVCPPVAATGTEAAAATGTGATGGTPAALAGTTLGAGAGAGLVIIVAAAAIGGGGSSGTTTTTTTTGSGS